MLDEQKHAETHQIFKIVDQNSLVGPSRSNSLLATPDRIFKTSGDARTRVLHNGTKTDLLLQFTSVDNVDGCTPVWVRRNREIFAASFARKCLRNLFANKEEKLNRILTVEYGKQRDMRRERKILMYSMAQERRMEQKARYRFLRTAVNSPFAPKNKKQQHFPTESKISTARMLISEFEILMRQFGVQIVSKAELESLFEAVKADKPERNYITLEQFLAWYLGNPRVTSCFSHGKARKWRSVRSGDYDMSMARLSIIRYCNQQARARGQKIFQSHLEDFYFLWNLMHHDKAAAAATDDLDLIGMQDVLKTPDTSQVSTNTSQVSPDTSQVSTMATSQVTPDTSQVSTMASAPLTPSAHDTSDSSCSARGASQRQQRARGHHFESKRLDDVDALSPIEPFPAPGTDYDRYDVQAYLDNAYLDSAKADGERSGGADDDADAHQTSDGFSDFDFGETYGSEASEGEESYMEDMFAGTPSRAHADSAQNLINSLLSFSYEDLANHVEAISPSTSSPAPQD